MNRLLEVAEARSGDVQRLAAENVALKEEVVQSLRSLVQEKDLQLAEERQRSTKQAEEIVRRRASLEEREQDLAGFQTDANQLREVLTERDAQLGHARSELQVLANSFYASYSWRITHPLRVAYDALRPLQRVLRRALRSALTLARFKVAQKTQPTFGPSDRRGSSADGVGARQEGDPSERA